MNTDRTVLISINTSWNIYHFRAPLIAALKAKGFRIISAAPEDVYTPRLKALVDQHIPLPMDNAGTSPMRDSALFFRYLHLLYTTKPDVMLSYTIKPNIYGALAARILGVPVIANVSGLGTAFLRNDWLTAFVKQLYRIAFRNVAYVFFQNNEDLHLFLRMKLVTIEKTIMVPGSGVDLDYFTPASVPAKEQSFLLVARLLWDKGVGEFVEAAKQVKVHYPDARFTLVGPKGVENQTAIADKVIEEWVAQGHIDYLGPREDIRELMAQYACVVLPSYREGMSRVLLEAAAMGKPIITTNVPGCKQAVEEGKNGLLCAAREAQSLTDAIMKFMALSPEQRRKMGQESRAKAEREFGQQHVFDAYINAIESLKFIG